MKALFVSFWNRILASARLAVVSNLEYRLNLFTDAVVQLSFKTIIEMTLWYALFRGFNQNLVGGFDRANYLSYALWAAYFSRVSTSWMYEHRMIDEIDSGSVNSVLVRPISFYEFYLGQFLGYKIMTSILAFLIPLSCTFIMDLPVNFARLPLALALVMYYLIFVHTLSFAISSLGFFFNRVHSLTVAKNISLWMLSGELIPLDLAPGFMHKVLTYLPFAAGVYTPVAYITGRIDGSAILISFVGLTFFLIVLGILSSLLWNAGRRHYSGTGA